MILTANTSSVGKLLAGPGSLALECLSLNLNLQGHGQLYISHYVLIFKTSSQRFIPWLLKKMDLTMFPLISCKRKQHIIIRFINNEEAVAHNHAKLWVSGSVSSDM